MSQEPRTPDLVELTRRFYASLNSRDFDAVMGMFGPASVWDVSRWGLGTHEGLRAIRQFPEDWFGSVDEYEVQVEEMHDLGNGIVLVVVSHVAYRARSRGALQVRSASIFVWTESTIALLTVYPDVDEGRATAAETANPHSQRNIDLHSQLVEAIRAREVPVELLAPDFHMENRATAATDHIYYGAEGLLELARDIIEAFVEEPRWEVEEVIAADDDFVVAIFSVVGRGAHSKEPLELHWVGVAWFREGKASRAIGYASRRKALEAVGLAE